MERYEQPIELCFHLLISLYLFDHRIDGERRVLS